MSSNSILNGEQLTLEVANIHSLPVQIKGIDYDQNPLIKLEKNIKGRKLKDPLKFQVFKVNGFKKGDNFASKKLRVKYSILGEDSMRYVKVFAWPNLDDDFISQNYAQKESNCNKFNFLKIDETQKKIIIFPGIWEIKEPIIFPKGYQVLCYGRTVLNLNSKARLHSYSPIVFRGTEEYPIVINSLDKTGQGLVVINAQEKSVMEYVIVNNLQSPKIDNWGLTGAVTFYESDVLISNCEFANNDSEDALNIVRSAFELTNSKFQNTKSDAFDADFCSGKVDYCLFEDIGNDAIDFSGSTCLINYLNIINAKDKGISVGEMSNITAKNITIEKVSIAITSKDESNLYLDTLEIKNCELGIAVFQKKQEFGPGNVTITGLRMSEYKEKYLVEKNSILVIDKDTIDDIQYRVKEQLYGMRFGKNSSK